MAIVFYIMAGINTTLAFAFGDFNCLNLGAAVFSFGMGLHLSIKENKVKIEFVSGDDNATARGH